MNNIKKNSVRKEGYKSTKTSYLKKKQNISYFPHNKYNKYKIRYNHPNKFSHYSYEYEYQNNSFFEKESQKNVKIQKKDLIEVNDTDFIYQNENKENISIYGNIDTSNEKIFQEKTNEKSKRKNTDSINIIEEDKSVSLEQELNSSESNTIILPNSTNNCSTNSQICSDDKENVEPNNINYNNINVSNVINGNNNNTNEFYDKNISSINLTSQDFKEAFYVPKRLNNLYNMYSKNNPLNIKELQQQQQSGNNFQNLSSISLGSSFHLKNLLNKNNILQNKNQNINNMNLLLNNNNNFLFSNNNLNFNSSNSNDSVQPFNLYDSHNSNSFRKGSSFDSFHSSIKTQISGSLIENEKEKENTDILEIYVKISEKNTLLFKIRRYDDMFKTVKIFCEINKLDTKLIRPLIIYIIKALNSIYGIYNMNLKSDEIKFLQDIKEKYFTKYNEETNNNEEEINNNNIDDKKPYFKNNRSNVDIQDDYEIE